MSCPTWILLVYIIWLPTTLRGQPALVCDKDINQVDTIQKGMGVFGKVLGIHGADTLALQGDLVLVEAEIVGEGVLSLCARQPQRIVAQRSSVQNMHIANPTKVIVQGDLKIEKSLVIEKGVFDSRMATLTLSDTCRFRVGKWGQLLHQENPLRIKQARTMPQSRPTSSIPEATIWHEIIGWKRGQLLMPIRFAQRPFRGLQNEHRPPSPPPESLLKLLPLTRSTERLG